MNIFDNFSHKLVGVTAILFCYTGFNCALAVGYYSTTKLCEEGYYLSSCNQVNVGTNWLKGIKNNASTSDYYSYGTSVSDPIHMINLRKFFAGVESITYTDTNGQSQTVYPSGYSETRNTILRTFCVADNANPTTETNIKCKKCPNNAKIPASTVTFLFGTLNSSKIHTIADCYMDEFSDHTGTYIYTPASAAAGHDAATKCYYSDNVEGDELVSE